MAPRNAPTDPIDQYAPQTAPRLTIAPSYTAPDGSVYVHQDYNKVVGEWGVESHIPPTNRTERFGSVEAWAAYVTDYAHADGAHLFTWSEWGLRAILDYIGPGQEPGRCTWKAEHQFEQTPQWRRWTELANGRARGQQELLEALEDNADDIVEPVPAEIQRLLRTMRGTVSATAESTLNEDGSYSVSWNRSATVKVGGGKDTTFPNEIKIAIPVFKGHVETIEVKDDDGTVTGERLAPVRFGLKVRIRVNPDNDGHLLFRLSMPDREAALEKALANRVQAAEVALGDGYDLLRATAS